MGFSLLYRGNYNYDLSLRPRKTQRVNSTTPRSRRFLKSFPIFPIGGMFFGVSAQSGARLLLCDSAGGGSTQPHRGQDFFQRLPNLQQCQNRRRWSKHSDFVFKTTMGFSPTLYDWLFKENLNASKPSTFSPVQMAWKRFDISPPWLGDAQNNTDLNVLTFWLGDA